MLFPQEKEGLARELDGLIEQCEASIGERDAARQAQAAIEVSCQLGVVPPHCLDTETTGAMRVSSAPLYW